MIETSANLVRIIYSDGELGKKQAIEKAAIIPCRVSSASRTEFYAAANSGFCPEWCVETHPTNYNGEGIIDLLLDSGTVRCDIYRTYIKNTDEIELWCVKQNPAARYVVTLWTCGKTVKLHGAYIEGEESISRETGGSISTSTVRLILPQSVQAFVGNNAVGYVRPKAYAGMSSADKAEHFCIDTSAFFAVGDIDTEGKYQAINAAYDDVYLVQGVTIKNRGKPDTEYLEVTGK